MNVWEDGLTLAPGAVGFSPAFRARLDALLHSLCYCPTTGQPSLYGFSKARDFAVLPPAAPIDSTSALLGCVDVVYTVLYHALGGQVQLAPREEAPGDNTARGFDRTETRQKIGNAMRTLFLSSTRNPDGTWSTPDFGLQFAEQKLCETTRQDLRKVQTRVFDTRAGTLTWDRATATRFWKRGKNVLWDKWESTTEGPLVFIDGRSSSPSQEINEALQLCCRRIEKICPHDAGMRTLLEIELDENGSSIECIRSLTFQASLLLILERLCERSMHRPDASSALCSFAGIDRAPDGFRDRAQLVFAPLSSAITQWARHSSLDPCRHAAVCRMIEEHSPGVVTMVEYDAVWRSLPTPAGLTSSRELVGGHGEG